MLKILAIIFTLLFLFMFIWQKELSPNANESILSKKEWGNLQSVTGKENPILRLGNARVIRFNSADVFINNDRNCKILLNSNFPPYIKIIGKLCDCHLTKEELNILRKKTNISNTVIVVLDAIAK